MSEHTTTGNPEACWLVARDSEGRVRGGLASLPGTVESRTGAEAVDGPLVRVDAAGFNYKDALACAGHPGVARTLPLVPGIDLAGTLLEPVAGLPCGAPIVATGVGLGELRHGGFATLARPPAAAVIARPSGLTARAAMAMGTAGLTVLIAIDRLARAVPSGHQAPADAEWLVTGASGGVGMLAVAALAAEGRRVVACSRKPAAERALRALGAASVEPPEAFRGDAAKPLARGRWAGVIDTVGGPILADALKAVLPGGVVAAIGMAGGMELPTTVYPFILRGVTLCGIDAATLPTPAERAALWPRLAALWSRVHERLPVTTLALDEVGDWAAALVAGSCLGRAVVLPAVRVDVRHTINLHAAWEPDATGTIWRRSFGRPSGLGPGDAVRLVIASPGAASVVLNGTTLPPLKSGDALWAQRVTPLLRDRNELVLAGVVPASAEAVDAGGRVPLPGSLGTPTLEIIAESVAS